MKYVKIALLLTLTACANPEKDKFIGLCDADSKFCKCVYDNMSTILDEENLDIWLKVTNGIFDSGISNENILAAWQDSKLINPEIRLALRKSNAACEDID